MSKYVIHKKEYIPSLLDSCGAGIYKLNHHTFESYKDYTSCLLDMCDTGEVTLVNNLGLPIVNATMLLTNDIPSGFHTKSSSRNNGNIDSLSSCVTDDSSELYIFAKTYETKLVTLASKILSTNLDSKSLFKLVEPTELTPIVVDHVLTTVVRTDNEGKIKYCLHGILSNQLKQFVKLFNDADTPLPGTNIGGTVYQFSGISPSFVGISKQFIQVNNLLLDRVNNTGKYLCGISDDEKQLNTAPVINLGQTLSDALLSGGSCGPAGSFCSIDIPKTTIHKTSYGKYFEWSVDVPFIESLHKVISEVPPEVPINKIIVSFNEIQPIDTYTSNTKYSVVSSDPFFYVTKSDTFQQSQLKAKTSRNIKSVLDPILNLLCFMLLLKDSNISYNNETEPNVFKYIFSPKLHISTTYNPALFPSVVGQDFIDILHAQFDVGFSTTTGQTGAKTNVTSLIEKIYSSVPITDYDYIYDNLLLYSYGVMPSTIRSYDRFNAQTEDYATLKASKINPRTNTKFSPSLEYILKSYVHVWYELINANTIMRFGTSEIRLNNVCNIMSKFEACVAYNYPDNTFKNFCLNNIPSGIKELDAFTDTTDTSNAWIKRAGIKKTEIPLGTVLSLPLDVMNCIKKIKGIKTFNDMHVWYTDNKESIDSMFDKLINISSLDEEVTSQTTYRTDINLTYTGFYLHKPFFIALKDSLPKYLKLLSDTEASILTPPVATSTVATVTETVEEII